VNYHLDTNTCIYALKQSHPRLAERLLAAPPSDMCISAMVKAELYYGAHRSERREKVLASLVPFLAPLRVVPFGDAEALALAEIRAALESRGQPIGCADMVIAATALAHGAVLVTANTREFHRVTGLRVEDWTK